MPDASDVMVERLMEWGVDTVFGIPGDGVNGIIEAFRKQKDRIRFIHVRHEESAAFMACAYAKFTGRLGVCVATSGPGGIHLLNGLYDAKMDGAPVLAITGLPYHDLIGTYTQQDVALDRLFQDVAVYSERVMGATHMEPLVDLAVRSALGSRGVAHLTVPVDIQTQELSKRNASMRNPLHHTSAIYVRSARIADQVDLEHAADILNRGEKIAILAGAGALHATDELEQLAEMLGAPIVKALLGKCAVPDNSPYTTGGIGLLGTRPSQQALENCDTLLIVGSSFPYMEYLPKPGNVKCVQIDDNPQRISLRFPADVGLLGDTKRTIQALLPYLKHKADRSFLEKAQKGMKDWMETLADRASREDKPMKPQVVGGELGKRLAENAIICSDSGTITTWWARYVPAKRGQMHSCSGTLASMACGLPYAIAAQVAYPERQVVCIIGDGAFSMLMGELITAVAYKLPIKIILFKNNSLGQIKWEQMVFLGNPEFACDLTPVDFAGVARACGAEGIYIDDPKDCGAALDRALATPGPVVVEAMIDQFEPPMPPKIKLEQAMHFAESLAKGEPNRMDIALTAISDRVREMI